jgi:hypothetical protein
MAHTPSIFDGRKMLFYSESSRAAYFAGLIMPTTKRKSRDTPRDMACKVCECFNALVFIVLSEYR